MQNIRILTPDVVDVLKKREWKDSSTALLKCTGCGRKNITGPIVVFFKFFGENLQCYECQKISKTKEAVPVASLPAEKVVKVQAPSKVGKYEANKNFRDWENKDNKITEKQITLLSQLIIEKIDDDNERQSQLDSMDQMTKVEASEIIGRFLKNEF